MGRTMVGLIVATALGAACSGGDSKQSAFPTTTSRKAIAPPLARRSTTTTVRRPTTTTRPAPPSPTPAPTDDLSLIQGMFDSLNAAYARSVAEGIDAAVASNYWVAANVYSPEQCTAVQSANGGDQIAETFTLYPTTLTPDPTWLDPVVRGFPQGNVYRVAIFEIRTNVFTGGQSHGTRWVHVVVPGDGSARLMLRC